MALYEDDDDVLTIEPEVITEQKQEDKKDEVHRLILWNDDVTPITKVVGVLVNHFKFTVANAWKKVDEIQQDGKSSVKEGSIKTLEKFFIILVDNELQATIE